MRHRCILPPPPTALTVSQMMVALSERRLSLVPRQTSVNAERQAVAEDLCERVCEMAARKHSEREYLRAQRICALVVAGWSFEDIDAAAGSQGRPMSAGDMVRAAEAKTLPPWPGSRKVNGRPA